MIQLPGQGRLQGRIYLMTGMRDRYDKIQHGLPLKRQRRRLQAERGAGMLLRQVEYFCEVVRTDSFTKASE